MNESQNCEFTKKEIWNYYSGILDRTEETKMQEHIVSCEECQKRLEQLQQLDEFISFDEDVNIEDDDQTQDSDPEVEVKEPTRKIITFERVLFATALVAVATSVVLYLVSPSTENSYPIDDDDPGRFGPGKVEKVDSTFIKSVKIDTLEVERRSPERKIGSE